MESAKAEATDAKNGADTVIITKLKPPVVFDCEGDFFRTIRLRPGHVIARGMTGPVVFAKRFDGDNKPARVVKMFPLEGDTKKKEKIQDQFLKEVWVMSRLSHPHIMGDIVAGRCPRYLAISMPFYKNNTLKEILDGDEKLSAAVVKRYTVQISAAMHYLHKMGVVHGDLKPENILMDDENNPVITDFGLSTFVKDKSGGIPHVNGGTPAYQPPEASQPGWLDGFKIDAYALGVTVWSLVVWENPRRAKRNYAINRFNKRYDVSDHNKFKHLVEHLLDEDTDFRWTVTIACQVMRDHLWTDMAPLLKSLGYP